MRERWETWGGADKPFPPAKMAPTPSHAAMPCVGSTQVASFKAWSALGLRTPPIQRVAVVAVVPHEAGADILRAHRQALPTTHRPGMQHACDPAAGIRKAGRQAR